jgi:hypothetical protein
VSATADRASLTGVLLARSGGRDATRVPPIRSRFLFNESLPPLDSPRPRLPSSDYYRAQHMADRFWSLVGPRYFPHRPQPVIDWAAGENAVRPAALAVTWPGSRLFPERPLPPPGVLSQPSVMALNPEVTQHLAGTTSTPYGSGVDATVLAHEWAHSFQTAPLLKDLPLLEGSAQAFAQSVVPGVLARLGVRYEGLPFAYPDWTDRALRRGREWVLRGQFGLGEGAR